MGWSKTLIPTLMQTPADAPSVAHGLMTRAGLIRQTKSGQVAYLPLGVRSLNKLSDLARDIFEVLGFAEVFFPQARADALSLDVAAAGIRSCRQLPQLFYQVTRGSDGPPSMSAFGFHADEAGARETWDGVQARLSELFRLCRIEPVVARTAGGIALAALAMSGGTKLLVSDAGD